MEGINFREALSGEKTCKDCKNFQSYKSYHGDDFEPDDLGYCSKDIRIQADYEYTCDQIEPYETNR